MNFKLRMRKRNEVINLALGCGAFIPATNALQYASSSFYRNIYLPKRLDFMKKLQRKCEKKKWKGIDNYWIGEFDTQIREVHSELRRLRRMPDALPHNPSEFLRTIPCEILKQMDNELKKIQNIVIKQ